MRTRWIRTARDGITARAGVRDLNKEPLSDSTMNVLAGADLVSLTIKHSDGSKIEYMAIEYECEVCGSYNHRFEACPELDADEPYADDDPYTDSPDFVR